MKREKRLTRKQRKAEGTKPQQNSHIHCVACGKHLDPEQFTASPPTAGFLACEHGRRFASCAACVELSRRLLETHDRTGQPVQAAAAWH